MTFSDMGVPSREAFKVGNSRIRKEGKEVKKKLFAVKKKSNTKEWPIRIFGTMRFGMNIVLSNILIKNQSPGSKKSQGLFSWESKGTSPYATPPQEIRPY